MREKHAISKGKWGKWSRGLLYHNSWGEVHENYWWKSKKREPGILTERAVSPVAHQWRGKLNTVHFCSRWSQSLGPLYPQMYVLHSRVDPWSFPFCIQANKHLETEKLLAARSTPWSDGSTSTRSLRTPSTQRVIQQSQSSRSSPKYFVRHLKSWW